MGWGPVSNFKPGGGGVNFVAENFADYFKPPPQPQQPSLTRVTMEQALQQQRAALEQAAAFLNEPTALPLTDVRTQGAGNYHKP